jgi:lantibiotic biosynthesis protein
MVVTALESDPAMLARLPVAANTLCQRCGGRLRVPAPASDGVGGPAEVCMRLTPAVALVLDAAMSPVRCGDLAGRLAAEFPATPARCSRESFPAHLVRHELGKCPGMGTEVPPDPTV